MNLKWGEGSQFHVEKGLPGIVCVYVCEAFCPASTCWSNCGRWCMNPRTVVLNDHFSSALVGFALVFWHIDHFHEAQGSHGEQSPREAAPRMISSSTWPVHHGPRPGDHRRMRGDDGRKLAFRSPHPPPPSLRTHHPSAPTIPPHPPSLRTHPPSPPTPPPTGRTSSNKSCSKRKERGRASKSRLEIGSPSNQAESFALELYCGWTGSCPAWDGRSPPTTGEKNNPHRAPGADDRAPMSSSGLRFAFGRWSPKWPSP